jgi:hypothetical protein
MCCLFTSDTFWVIVGSIGTIFAVLIAVRQIHNGTSPQMKWNTCFFSEAGSLILLQRFITPDEVAAAVLKVSSELAAATNSANIRADGGILKGIHLTMAGQNYGPF